MKFRRRVAIFSGQLELTPLVDVVLLLLIFFVLSSRYLTNPGIEVEVPESVATTNPEATDLVITITQSNAVYFRGTLISPVGDFEALHTELKKIKLANPETPPRIIINADEKVPWGRVVQIMDITWVEGFPTRVIGTRPKEPR